MWGYPVLYFFDDIIIDGINGYYLIFIYIDFIWKNIFKVIDIYTIIINII